MVTDCHAHAFPDELAPHALARLSERVPNGWRPFLDGTAGGLLAGMDRSGIDRTVVACIATAPQQFPSILAWACRIASDRLVPFASVHPGSEGAAAQVHVVADAGLRGIKLHAQYQQFAVDEPRMFPLYEAACERGLVVLFHAGRDIAFPDDADSASPARLRRVHERFPQMRMIAAHLGGWRMWRESLDALVGCDVYLETSYSLGMGEDDVGHRILAEHRPDRLLFGTDSPWRDQAETLRSVRSAVADGDRLRMLLEDNACTLIGPQRP
jgi:predicted TIM-barrel fold metal-dependent hydrolase